MICCSISTQLFHIPSKSLIKSNTAKSPDGCRHLIYVIATAIGWTIPRGPTEVANVYHVVWSLPSCFRGIRLCVIGWTIPRGSTQIERCLEAWNLRPCCLIFYTIVANMLCKLFGDCKYMDIYLPHSIHRGRLGVDLCDIMLLYSAATY